MLFEIVYVIPLVKGWLEFVSDVGTFKLMNLFGYFGAQRKININ